MSRLLQSAATIASAIALSTMLGCSASPTRESPAEYVDDTVITTKVKAALIADPQTKVLQVNVETYKGVVQLSGFVASQAIASRAVELSRAVKGVTEVKNDMRLR